VGEARAPDATPDTLAYALTIIEQRARIARDLARHAIGSPRIDEQLPAGIIAREVVEALRVEASRAGATIVVSGDEPSAKVAGALDVSQVLTNLVLNALAYTPRGSDVEIEVSADDERCWIIVADRGPGVPAALRNSIFHGESLRPGGTGVGLRHSRALARAWGGDIELLPPTEDPSAPPGARFRVCWPRVDSVPRPPVSTPRLRELANMRVLLVEDDTAVTLLLETALEGRGADVTIASNSAELAAALNAGPYHAALVDLSPIAHDVGGAIARLRTSSPGIDLVCITGSADRLPDEVASESIKLVRKPFELGEVFAALAKKP
jgi:CheY-like chemotaxis protein/anti-sigma regulatory factor (Ser/Thr protein kinase)